MMLYQTSILFSFSVPFAFYCFLFFGTLCSYNFHWYLTPPHSNSVKARWHQKHQHLHLFLVAVSAVSSVAAASFLLTQWSLLLGSALIPLIYSAPQLNYRPTRFLRRIAIGKTIFLSVAWVHATVLLPFLLTNQKIASTHYAFLVNRFFFIYAVCILFDLRDRELDQQSGIRSLVTWLSLANVQRLFLFSVFVSIASSLLLTNTISDTQIFIINAPTLLLGLLYPAAQKTSSDFFYYFLLDGLLGLSAAIIILAKFAR